MGSVLGTKGQEAITSEVRGTEAMGLRRARPRQQSNFNTRAWQIKLRDILVNELKFKSIYSDGSFFVYRADNDFVLLPFHVDDGTLAASSDALIDRLIARLSTVETGYVCDGERATGVN